MAIYRNVVEALEGRLLLSAAPKAGANGLTAIQLSHLHTAARLELHHAAKSVAGGKGTPFSDVSSNLVQLYGRYAIHTVLSRQDWGSIESRNNEPGVAIRVRGNLQPAMHELNGLGFQTLDLSACFQVIDGFLPLDSLEKASALHGILEITALVRPIVHSVGSAPDQADATMRAQLARSMYNLTGAGVKIGVISDSVSRVGNGLAGSIASGDLPANVQVLRDGNDSVNDTDEGRAILEEIHDIAPGASLAFYSGDGDQTSFAAAVDALHKAGCTIIVDDLGYPDEPFFQPGVIDQAINRFVAAGGSYFSAVGNDGKSGYLNTNVQYTANPNHTTWVNFAGNGLAAGENLVFTTNGPVDITLQWDNPYDGTTGHATSDLDVFIYDSTGSTLLQSATTNNIASGYPEEVLTTLNAGTYQMRVQVVALSPGATLPNMLKFVAAEDSTGGLTSVNYPAIWSSAYGHSAGLNTIGVGAVDYATVPPYSSKVPLRNEDYSSTGPIVYAFDAGGKKLPTPLMFNQPDISGVDGVTTSFFGDGSMPLPRFFGTSAAAPNVAAIAALIDQYRPGSSQAVILAVLEASATPLNGAAAGTWNSQGGYGLVDAVKALNYFAPAAIAPTVKLSPILTPRTSAISSELIMFNEAVTGVTLAGLTLTRNGGPNLLTNAQTLKSTDQKTFTLGNLTAITTLAGTYILTLKTTGIAGQGLALTAGATLTWKTNSTVLNRRLFYNDSFFDKYTPGISPFDDTAIAPDKTALLPGHAATFANYSSYSRGINGIMLDIAGLPAGKLTAADFIFKTGNTSTVSTWTAAPAPSSIVVRPGAGQSGSSRIELVWLDHSAKNLASAIAGKWLQVTIRADPTTGLAASDVFYFGNAIGATGLSAKSAAVTPADKAAIKSHESNKTVPVTNTLDIDRNGKIDATDVALTTPNETTNKTALQLIAPH